MEHLALAVCAHTQYIHSVGNIVQRYLFVDHSATRHYFVAGHNLAKHICYFQGYFFISHWNEGVGPAFTTVAVSVSVSPAAMLRPGLAVMVTTGGVGASTCIVR